MMVSPPVASPDTPPPAALFMSGHRSFRAHGVAFRVDVPAADSAAFAQARCDAFAAARAAGMVRPLLMGAIPFDTRQPSQLFIPQHYHDFARRPSAAGQPRAGAPLSVRSIPDEQAFKRAVRQAKANFRHSEIRKTVLSRLYELQFAAPVAVDAVFAALCAQNPHAYQFRLPLAGGGELIGASPELLLRKQGTHIASHPLAGSARRRPGEQADSAVACALLASVKDDYEHHLVSAAIGRVLAPYCRELQVPARPSLLAAGAMWHLGSPIAGELHDVGRDVLGLACLLHPTPAVCGSPTALSRKLIDLIEPFERGLFSGLVGWCDEDGDGEWVVTIRCATICNNRVRLFAGAGIVDASCPDAEWAETEAKLGTMLGALGLAEAA